MNECFLFAIASVVALVGVTTGNYWLLILSVLVAALVWHLD